MTALDTAPLDAQLDNLVDSVSGHNAAPAFLRAGEQLANDWRSRVSSEGLVRTGKYRDSIGAILVSTEPDFVQVAARTEVFYARFLEFGTDRMRAHHPAQKAYLANRDAILEKLKGALAALVEKIGV